MQQVLKVSTAATTIVGPILDTAGAAYTGAVIGDLNITKNGTTAAMAAAATLTHDHNGHYILVFTAGNTDTIGRLDITCNKATYAMPPKVFEVLKAVTFDALVTNGTLASTLITTGTTTSAGTATSAIDSGRTETDTGYYRGMLFKCTSGLNAGITRLVTAYFSGGNFTTRAFPNTIASGVTYEILPFGEANVAQWDDVNVATSGAQPGIPVVVIKDGTGTGELDTASGRVLADMVYLAGAAITDTTDQVAARFSDFFNQASAGHTVATQVSTLTAAQVNTEADTALSDYGALKPTVASRTLDVSATGEAGIDWANIGGVGTTVNLSATTISTVTGNVGAVVGAVGSVSSAVTVGTINANVITATSIATDAITAAKIAADAIGASELAADAVTEIVNGVWNELQSGHTTAGTFGKYLDAQVSLVTAPTAATVAAAVWDLSTTGHTTSGTFGAAMVAAGSAGDPWATLLPGAYGAGTAGKIVGDNINATISSRSTLTAAQVNTEADTALSDVGLTTTVTGRIDAAITSRMATFGLPANFSALLINASGHVSRVTLADTVTTYTGNTPQTGDNFARLGAPTGASIAADIQTRLATSGYTAPDNAGITAVKAKTDNLTFTTANKVDAKLTSDGLDNIPVTAPAGVATTYREMVVQTWRRFFKKSTLTTTQLKTYADDGTTTVTTQVVSDDGTTQTQGAAT